VKTTAQLQVFADAEAAAQHLAALLIATARQCPGGHLMLAGGNTPRRAYQLLSTLAGAEALTQVHLWFSDERMVAASDERSNHHLVRDTFFDRLGGDDRFLHRIAGELGAEAATRLATYELAQAGGGKPPRFDLIVLGVGVDGHTASLFPGDPALGASGGYSPARGGQRVTATVDVLSAARHVVFFATGAAKAQVIAQILGGASALPAAAVHAEDITWIVDAAAAAAISNLAPAIGH
jgi:6-phosphogluconolactonase